MAEVEIKHTRESSSSVRVLKSFCPATSLNSPSVILETTQVQSQSSLLQVTYLHDFFLSPPVLWDTWQQPTSLCVLRGPHEPHSKEVLEIVKQRVGDSETLVGPNRGLT